MEPKQIYITRREASWTADNWVPRWRQHGRLARSLQLWDEIRHYEQCAVLPRAQVEGAGMGDVLEQDYAGVGMVWFREPDSFPRAIADPRVGELLHDETLLFEKPIGEVTVFTREVVKRDTGATRVKIVAFVKRKDGLTRAEFQDHWEHRHGDIFLGVPEIDAHVTKYVQNHVLDDFPTPLGERFDGVAEIGFASIDDIPPTFGTGGYMAVVRPDEESFLAMDAMTVVMTDETLLYEDALAGPIVQDAAA